MNNSYEEQKNTPEHSKPASNTKNEIKELIRFIVLAAIIIVPFRIFIAQPFVVNGASMDPTFETNQYLIVERLSYRSHEPQRGDVIVFRYPNNPSDFYIKRIIGLPGETVMIKGGDVYIQEVGSIESYKLEEPYIAFQSNNNITTKVGQGEYFVMGDNRPNSSDSRTWGTLDREFIIGKAFLRLLPLNKIDFHPGEHFTRITEDKL